MRSSSFLCSRFSVVSFIYLITSAPPHFKNNWGKAWSELSSAPLNMHPGSNLLLTVPGLFLASEQLSKSTEALPGCACPHSNSHLTVTGGGRMRRKPINLFCAPDNSLVSAEIQEGLTGKAPGSFQMHPPALLFICPLSHLEGKALLLSRVAQHSFTSDKRGAEGAVKASSIPRHTHRRHWMKEVIHFLWMSLKRTNCPLRERRVQYTNRR